VDMNVKFKFGLRGVRGCGLFFGFLMSVLLVVSLFSCLLVVGAVGPSLVGPVESEAELVAAVNDAQSGVPVVIALGKAIVLSAPLRIPANVDVTLESEGGANFRLVGAAGVSTVIVESAGILRLNGIIVTHDSGARGSGVNVTSGGTLILLSGMISNNLVSEGAGVANYGVFTMSGGAVSNNTATNGGGVLNYGSFTLSGGEIFNNTYCGVFNGGNFVMSGGKNFNNTGSGVVIDYNGNFSMAGGEIYKNNAGVGGGGVYIRSSYGIGNFTLSGGLIYNNTALELGGGVYNEGSIFKMTGGVLSNNTANLGGGVYINGGNITVTNGKISNNTAQAGGGVYNYLGIFDMSDGEIFNNTARNGGGAYTYGGDFSITGGKISNNTATLNGGGIGVSSLSGLEYVYVQKSVTFSDNRASTSYNRNSVHDELYRSHIGSEVTWTKPFTQGYNNYDIMYTSGSQTNNGNNPSSKPGVSTSPSPTNTIPGSSGTTTPHSPGDGPFNPWSVGIIIALFIGLIIAILIFYLPKRKHATEDWIDSATA